MSRAGRRAIALAVAALSLLAACGRDAGSTEPSRPRAETLERGTRELRAAFQERRGATRLLAVLSPACPRCRDGAAAATGPALRADPDLQVLLVWMPVLPWDLATGSRKRVEAFHDPPHVIQFLDPGQHAGRLVAERLGWTKGGPAYDVYLVFGPEASWEQELPAPRAVYHQLRDREAARYRTGAALTEALVEAVRSATAEPPRPAR